MVKPILCFYTNMPTPYQLDFFDALCDYFQLEVVYFTDREKDRLWNLEYKSGKYKISVLKNSFVAKFAQRWIPSFHFSWRILSHSFNNKAVFVVINGTYWSPNVVLAMIVNKIRGKVVSFWSEPVFSTTGALKRWIKYFALFPVRHFTDFLLAIGINSKESFTQFNYSKPIYLIPYNINLSLFEKNSLNRDKLDSLFSKYKRNDEVLIITSGSLIRRKGIDIVVQAFQMIDVNINARLLIVGEGPQLSDLMKLAGSSDRIVFLGFQEKEELPYWYNISDIFICASRYDGWALVINEALASDLPIISSLNVGAVKDKLQNEVNVLLCNVGDTESFKNAMEKLIHNPSLRDKLVENSGRVKIELSSDYNAQRLIEIWKAHE